MLPIKLSTCISARCTEGRIWKAACARLECYVNWKANIKTSFTADCSHILRHHATRQSVVPISLLSPAFLKPILAWTCKTGLSDFSIASLYTTEQAMKLCERKKKHHNMCKLKDGLMVYVCWKSSTVFATPDEALHRTQANTYTVTYYFPFHNNVNGH